MSIIEIGTQQLLLSVSALCCLLVFLRHAGLKPRVILPGSGFTRMSHDTQLILAKIFKSTCLFLTVYIIQHHGLHACSVTAQW